MSLHIRNIPFKALPFLLMLVFLSFTPISAQPPIPWKNQATFDFTKQEITFEPNGTGLFRFGENNRIVTADGSNIKIYAVVRGYAYEVFSGPPVNHAWPPGYYYVESATDRSAFCVLPLNYNGVSHLGADSDLSAHIYQDNFRVARLGWTRIFWNFAAATTDSQYGWRPHEVWAKQNGRWLKTDRYNLFKPGEWNFGALKRIMNWADAHGLNVFLQLSAFPSWIPAGETSQKSPQNYASWCAQVFEFISQQPEKHCIKVVGIPINEPYYIKDFHYAVPDSRQSLLYQWRGVWSGSYNDWLAEAAPLVAEAARKYLPWIEVAGGNHMDFGHAYESLAAMRDAGCDMTLFDALNHHHYDGIGKPDEAIFAGMPLREKYSKLRSFFQRAHRIYLDEFAVGWSRRSPGGDLRDALGIPYVGTEHMQAQLAGQPYADWWTKANDLIKEACILREHDAVIVGHQICRGSMDASKHNGMYDGWFPGINKLRGPRYATAVWLAANHWLDGAQYNGRRELFGRVVLYHFILANGRGITIGWTRPGTVASYHQGSDISTTDVFGRKVQLTQLTEEPIIFHKLTPRVAVEDKLR